MHQAIRSSASLGNVKSIAALIDAMKTAQVSKPRAKFSLSLGGEEFSVALLPAGYIEVDGRVPSLSLEKEFEQALSTSGAMLRTIN